MAKIQDPRGHATPDEHDAATAEARARANQLAALPNGARATQIGAHIAEQQTSPLRATPRRTRGFATVLRNRYFLRLWMAQLISQTIMNAANYGLIILVTTQVQSFTATSGAIVAFSLPAVFFGAPAGVLVDRFDRRLVLWVSNVLRAFASVGFVVTLIANHSALVPVYLLAFLTATVGQFFAPAEGAAIPLLVHPDELINALSLFNVTFTLAQAAGMIVFGPLVLLFAPSIYVGTAHHGTTLLPVQMLFLLIAVLYVVCAVLIWSIPHRRLRPVVHNPAQSHWIRHESRQIRSIWSGMAECWDFIRRDQCLFVAVIQLAFAGAFIAVIAMIAPRFVIEFFHRPPELAALVFVPAGAGLVLGSAFIPRIALRLGYIRTVLVGVITLALAAALLPLIRAIAAAADAHGAWWNAWPYLGIMLSLTFIIGVALDLINVPAQTMMQERSPDWIKGRVLSVQALLLNAATIPFVLIMGRVADIFSLMPAIEVLAVVLALVGLTSVYYGIQGQRLEMARGGISGSLNAGSPLNGEEPLDPSSREG